MFGVGKETFENSTFFGQQNLVSGINDDIRASLSTGILSGDDVDNYEKAQNIIQKRIKEVKSEIKALKIEELNDDYERTKAKEEVLKIRLERVEGELKQITQTQQNISKTKKTVNEKEAVAYINRNVALESVIDSDKERIIEKEQQKSGLLKDIKIQKQDYDFLRKNENIKKGHNANNALFAFLVLAIVGGVCLICGGMLHFNILFIFASVLTLISLVGLIICIFIARSCAEDLKRYSEIMKNYKLSSKNLNLELENFDKVVNDIKFIDEEIVRLNTNVEKNSIEAKNIQKQFKMLFGCEIQNYYSENNAKSREISSLEKKNIELLTDKKHFVEELESLHDKLFELSDNIASKNEKLLEYQKKLEILAKTTAFLEHSRDAISNRYIEPVSNRFNKYYKRFLDDGDEIIIDSNLGLRFGERYNEIDYLSAGLYDLVYICKRFALIDLLFKKEKPAIILDDPFANFDDDKLEVAKNLLKELKDDYQIILFTCQKARA